MSIATSNDSIALEKPNAPRVPSRWTWGAVGICLIVVLAAVLRSQELSRVSLHCDEGFVQRMVEFSWTEMFDRIGRDTHPPFYYVLYKLWSSIFGPGVVIGRILSVFFGLAAVVGMYLFVNEACRYGDRGTDQRFADQELPALLAALLLAITPLQIFWSQQIRMYALSVALVTWSCFFAVRICGRGGRRDWIAYMTCAILLTYTHYFGLFIVAAQFIFLGCRTLVTRRGERLTRVRGLVLAAGTIWFAWQPWLLRFLDQRQQVAHGFFPPKPSWTVVGKLFHEVWIDFGVATSATSGLVFVQILLITVLILLARGRPGELFLVAISVIPPTAVVVVSAFSHSLLNGRYFLVLQAPWIAAIAVVICRLWYPLRYPAVALAIAVLTVSCREHWVRREHQARLPAMPSAISRIDAARGDEPLLVSNPLLYVSAVGYTSNRGATFLYRPPHGFPYFQGTAVVRDEQYLDRSALNQHATTGLWTLDGEGWLGRVPAPDGWRLLHEEVVPDGYIGNLTTRFYAPP